MRPETCRGKRIADIVRRREKQFIKLEIKKNMLYWYARSTNYQEIWEVNTNMEFKKNVHEEATTDPDLGQGFVQSWALVSVVIFCCSIQSNSTIIDDGLCVESSWNVMAGGDAREGKWRGNWPIEWVEPVLYTLPRNIVNPALLPLMRTPLLPVIEWTDDPADLNGLVRFAERRNLVSARVPSYFKRRLLSFAPLVA